MTSHLLLKHHSQCVQQLQKELGAQNKKVEATKISGDTLVNELLDNPEPVKGSLELMSTRWDDACKASETRQNRLDQALLVSYNLKVYPYMGIGCI